MDLQKGVAFHPITLNGANKDRKFFISDGVFIKIDQNIARGKNEAHILASISHPYIQKYVDSYVIDGKHILKTEYFPSDTLENISLNKKDARKVEVQIFDVFSYLVKRGVVHNDINVSNILFDGENILLVDWETSYFGDTLKDLVGPPTSTNHCGIINVVNDIRGRSPGSFTLKGDCKDATPLDINESFVNKPLSWFKDKIVRDNKLIFDKYNGAFDYLSHTHPLYRSNWRVNFLDNHRFMNWILYTFFSNACHNSEEILFSNNIPCNFTVMDIGCYDSCLVSALNNNGVKTYGYDDNDWSDMFTVLNTSSNVNTKKTDEPIDIAVVLNYAHNFKPDDLLAFVKQKCGNMPSLIFFDFDTKVQHGYHHLYEASRSKYTTIRFAASKERELYIWHG